MFSKQAKEIAEACRFCWMCRYICPVGLVTGCESNTPRARGLLVSMDSRNIPLTADSTEIMYQCSLCGACANDCATGYDPRVFTREARTNAVVNGFIPEHIQQVIARAYKGSLNGQGICTQVDKAVRELPAQAPVLLYLGDSARSKGDSALAVMELLKKAGISYTVMENEPDCGAHLGDLIGYVDEVRQMAVRCFDAMKKTRATTLVVLDPSYMSFIRHQCAKWEILPEFFVVTATSYCAQLIKDGKLCPKQMGGTAAYHDPCHLARDLEETQPARDIIAAMGITLKELFLNRKLSRCCGGPVMQQTNPSIVEKMAQARWEDVKLMDETMLITSCPGCGDILGQTVPEGMKHADLFQLLNESCK